MPKLKNYIPLGFWRHWWSCPDCCELCPPRQWFQLSIHPLCWIVGVKVPLKSIYLSKTKLKALCLKITKKSQSTLRAKCTTFTFWEDKYSKKKFKKWSIWQDFKTWSWWSSSVTRQISFNRTKISRKCQNWKSQFRHFGDFQATCERLL